MTTEVLCAQLFENNRDCSHWHKRCITCPWIRWSQSLACLSNSATGRPLVREVLWQEFSLALQRGMGPWVAFSHLVLAHAEGWDIDLTLLGMRQCPVFVFYGCATDCACVCAQLLQLCLTLCDPMDCSPSGSSVHGILQTRVWEWVAMPSSSVTDYQL